MSDRRYDAILLDLDGTLVDDAGRIPARTLERLRNLHGRGVKVMIATGRSEGGTLDVLDQLGLDTPAVVFNGAGIWCPVERRLIEERLLADAVVRDLVRWTAENDMLPVVIGAGAKVCLAPRNEFEERAIRYFHDLRVVPAEEVSAENVIRVTVFSALQASSGDLRRAIVAHLGRPVYVTDFPLRWLVQHRDSPLLVADVQPPCRGKAEGLRYLQERYGIPPERVVAVGDATNDVPMLEAAGLGIAMRNSMPEALAAADRIIGDNNSDALAALIDELFPSSLIQSRCTGA